MVQQKRDNIERIRKEKGEEIWKAGRGYGGYYFTQEKKNDLVWRRNHPESISLRIINLSLNSFFLIYNNKV